MSSFPSACISRLSPSLSPIRQAWDRNSRSKPERHKLVPFLGDLIEVAEVVDDSTFKSAEAASSNICKDWFSGHTVLILRVLESDQMVCLEPVRGITRIEDQRCVSHDRRIIEVRVVRDDNRHVARTKNVTPEFGRFQIVAFHAQ